MSIMSGEHVAFARTAAMSHFREVGGWFRLGDSGGSGKIGACAGRKVRCVGFCGDGILVCPIRGVGGNPAPCNASREIFPLECGIENADNIVNAPQTLSLA
jgi:hypothetical protein